MPPIFLSHPSYTPFIPTLCFYFISHPLSIIHFQLSKPFSLPTLTTIHLTHSNLIQLKLHYIDTYFNANKKRKLWLGVTISSFCCNLLTFIVNHSRKSNGKSEWLLPILFTTLFPMLIFFIQLIILTFDKCYAIYCYNTFCCCFGTFNHLC